jgi:uncharacterized protein (TIGR01777 family)
MRVVIPGGSGQVGTLLAGAFHARGHEVVVLSRQPKPTAWRVVPWDAETRGAWAEELEGADALINLAGRSVNCRYNAENRRLIKESRVRSTRVLGEATAQARRAPRVWLQASTATIDAHRYDVPNDEVSGILGGSEPNVPDTWRFSIDVAQSWERAAEDAVVPQTRKVLLRSAMVMRPDPHGVFDVLLGPVRRGLGGRFGDGRQYVSWIYDQDFIHAIDYLIDHEELSGPVNLASPQSLPNAEFMRRLREAWGIRFGLPATEWMLALAAWLMRSETELVLKSRRVVPGRLLDSGFAFQFPAWPEASRDLCQRWRRARETERGRGN